MTAAAWLCLAALLPLGSIGWDIFRTPRDGAWTPRPKRRYEAPYHQQGPDLPHRPEGMQALKAEIGRHRMPELKVRKDHPDWPWDTHEFEMRWDEWFADQPDDQAVAYEWAGTGQVAS